MVAQTGCDAIMIGRTAASNPWIFRQIAQYNAAIKDSNRATGNPFTTSLPTATATR